MINELTKNTNSSDTAGARKNSVAMPIQRVPSLPVKGEDAIVNSTSSSQDLAFGSLSLEQQQYLLSSDGLYKCASRDSLSSLQQLVGRTPTGSPRRKFITEDHSDYTHHHFSSLPTGSAFTTTNFLRPRMEFSGYQISGYKKYQVEVSLKTVDLPINGISSLSPHITGFLTIRGLTNQHPEITTYFEAYAVTHRDLGFLSSSWANDLVMNAYKADDQTDLEHWLNFPSFKQLFLTDESQLTSGSHPTLNDVIDCKCDFGDYLEQRFIFMRWKEKFLVPDAMIDGVAGASYDGFYYIVHDQVTGNIQGFYYHQDAEKFQQLELIPSFKSLSDCSNCTFEFA